jgi:hypothetical protein
MATYKEIFGKKIQALSADPPASVGEGQIWYNDTSDAFKTSTLGPAAWASGGVLPATYANNAAAGTQTSAMVFSNYPSSTATASYNGTSWTAAPALTTARQSSMGFGASNTSAIVVGGDTPGPSPLGETEQFNGSSWSEVADLTTPRGLAGACGIVTAGLVFAGGPEPTRPTNAESWDGSAWSEGANVNTGTYNTMGCGTQTAALKMGGIISGGGSTTSTEDWNGTSWTAATVLPLVRGAGAAAGTQTNALLFGGSETTTRYNTTIGYDGSSWTAQPNLATARNYPAGAGTASLALAIGGNPAMTTTEEYTNVAAVKTITAS